MAETLNSDPNWDPYHPRKCKKKLCFRHNFGTFGQNLDHQCFFVDFTSARCYDLLQFINQTWEYGKKTSFGHDFVNYYYGQLSSIIIWEKANNPMLRELSDGRTDRQARVMS